MAKGDALNGPDPTMIRFLLDFLPRLMPIDPDEDTPMKQMLRGWQGDLHLHQHVDEPLKAVEGKIIMDMEVGRDGS